MDRIFRAMDFYTGGNLNYMALDIDFSGSFGNISGVDLL